MKIRLLHVILLYISLPMVWAQEEWIIDRCVRQVDPFFAERILRCEKGEGVACSELANNIVLKEMPCMFTFIKKILDSNCQSSKDKHICSASAFYRKHKPKSSDFDFIFAEGFLEFYAIRFANFMDGRDYTRLTIYNPLLGNGEGCRMQLTEQLFLEKAALRRYHKRDILQCYVNLLDEIQRNKYLK